MIRDYNLQSIFKITELGQISTTNKYLTYTRPDMFCFCIYYSFFWVVISIPVLLTTINYTTIWAVNGIPKGILFYLLQSENNVFKLIR